MTERTRARLAVLGVLVILAVFVAAGFGALDLAEFDDPADPDPNALTIDTPVYVVDPPVTAAAVSPVTPPATGTASPSGDGPAAAVTPTDQLVTRGTAAQIGDTVPPAMPEPIPGDCDSWRRVFAWYGATDLELQFFFGDARPWGVPRTNIIRGESSCGLDFVNESTSDRYVCMLNGVHAQPGYAFGTYYGDGGWMRELFGLPGGRAVTDQAAASTPTAVPACLWLLRGGFTPDAFDGASHWQPQT